MEEQFKKCSFCKCKFKANSLKEFRKNNYKSLGSVFICKVCEKKVDIKEYQSKSTDNYVINELRYKNKINYGIDSTNEILELQLLNIKLKREIKNDSTTKRADR
jgi:uncharacterized CHY-type Zn-finger protein